MATLWWNNLLLYSVQIGMVVAAAAIVPALLRLRHARARLAFWQIVLAACLLLPFVHPWRQQLVTGDISVTTTVLALNPVPAPAPAVPFAALALGLVGAGALIRLVWLGAGFRRLRRYRRTSRPLSIPLPLRTDAEVCIAEGIASPVTFGALRPVVLVPPQFPVLSSDAQTAILSHELLHVVRRDWAFTVAEEFVRAVLWFHPAIWWLLSEIQLAREQAVDAEVVRLTQGREEYVDALLAIAGARPEPDLVPAPLFLRRRHLKQRVVSLFEEVRMSKTRVISALAAGLCVLFVACWFAAATFPLSAAPQVVNDAAGVSVDTGGANLLHRTGVAYPESARAKGVQGTVALEVQLDDKGNVSDARVLSGPQELRNSTLQSVLQWHFTHDAAGTTRQVTVAFQLPAEAGNPAAATSLEAAKRRAEAAAGVPQSQRPSVEGRTVRSVSIVGLSATLQQELLARLPLHQGDTITELSLKQTAEAVSQFDEHLRVTTVPLSAGDAIIQIAAPGTVQRIKIGGNVQQMKLVSQARPLYPPEAKAQRVQGKVQLQAVINKDGTMQSLQVLSGDPLLVPSAMEAVKQWVYQPTLLNGEPVEVQTQIDVNYTLSQ